MRPCLLLIGLLVGCGPREVGSGSTPAELADELIRMAEQVSPSSREPDLTARAASLARALSTADAASVRSAVGDRLETAPKNRLNDRGLLPVAAWMPQGELVRLFGDRPPLIEAARRTHDSTGASVGPSVEYLAIVLRAGPERAAGELASWLAHRANYDDLALAPPELRAALTLALASGRGSADSRLRRAEQRMAVAFVEGPLNHYLVVDGASFHSATSLRVTNGSRSAGGTLARCEAALLEVDWERWWRDSRAGASRTGPGGIEFDFWPLVIAGQAPTKVRLRLGRPVPPEGVEGPARRIEVELLDDGKSQLVGRAHWLLVPDEPREALTIHSVFDRVEPAANYRADWAEVEHFSWDRLNLNAVFGRMHVWVEGDEGPFPLVEKVEDSVRSLLTGLLHLRPGPEKSGLPGLADFVERAAE
jgi:hypothetical protein